MCILTYIAQCDTMKSQSRTTRLKFQRKKGIKKMSTTEITSKIEKLQEWEALIKEAEQEAESLRDEIKMEMLARDTEELTSGKFIVRWTSVLTQRFDSTAFKKALPDVYKAFTKQTASRRFTISG